MQLISIYLVTLEDLLKSIHYFAANYYSERGQLLNISREDRAKRKAKRLEKRAERQAAEGRGSVDITASRSSSPQKTQKPHHGSDDEDDFDSEDEDGEEDEDKDDSEEDEEYEDTSRKEKKLSKRDQGPRFRDMYKVFDGSALMAIGLSFSHLVPPNADSLYVGMIVQEHVTRLLEPRVPDGWEDSVRTAFPNGVWADDQEESEEETWLRDVKIKGAGIFNDDNGEVGEGDNEEEQDGEGDNEEKEEDNEEGGEEEEEGEDEEEGDSNVQENYEEDEEEKTEDDENQTPRGDDSEGSHVMTTRKMTRKMTARKAKKP